MQIKSWAGLMVLVLGASAHCNELWSYEGSGAPENWGKLSQEFQICEKGFNQSPIDIQRTVNGKLPALDINIHVKNQEIINNGHSIQINVANDDDFSIDGKDYNLKQFHFHSPSENKIKGKNFPLEIHFVHAMEEDGNRLAVLAVMVEEGKPNPAIAEILKSLPAEKNKAEALNTTINISSLYPKSRHYYRFSGSLTTPPCTEGVVWLVMKQSIKTSKAQIEAFEEALEHANNRPPQPLNGRVVVE
ncbi:carbonic anhydrase [Comamonas sp. GB3 AK4-5]|uniref:carbonic anhydrase n=1 Tax=Comamonas sp. GB3 AK4-5 TaxID=3231487 RepID=UPI00351E7FE3